MGDAGDRAALDHKAEHDPNVLGDHPDHAPKQGFATLFISTIAAPWSVNGSSRSRSSFKKRAIPSGLNR
jgi:hypothetical protein